MAETKKTITTPDGRKISEARWRYEQNAKQEAVIRNVNTLIQAEATAAVSVGADFGQQEFGGLLRNVVPNLLDDYGAINATAAVNYYNEMRDTYRAQNVRTESRTGFKRKADRFAIARTRAAVQINQDPTRFVAQYAPTYDTISKSDAVINYTMKVRATAGHAPSVDAMNRALTREVASYHRDTVLFNAALDPYVDRVQRVAQFNACEFCRLMALGSTNGTVRTSSYAVKFHDNCHCTITPLFKGEQPIRPDYYDEFEKQYQAVSGAGKTSDEILAAWRKELKDGRPIGAPAPTPVTNSVDLAWFDNLGKAKSPAEIVKLMEQKWSSRGIEFRNLAKKTFNTESVREVARTFDNLLTEFPKANISALQSKESKGRAFAWVQSRHAVSFSGPVEPGNISDMLSKRQVTKFATNEMTIVGKWLRERDSLTDAMKYGSTNGHFHDVNIEKPMEYVVSHEFGHVLDFTLRKAGKDLSVFKVRDEFLASKGLDKMSREGRELYREQSSEYGRSDSAELLAEAFADVKINGDKAKEFSKFLYAKLMERLNELD